ncbi:MAG: STAS domain-containing protein [Candidatus Omnitrophota bacterium]
MEYRLELNNPHTAILHLKDSVTVYQLQKMRALLDEIKDKLRGRKRLIFDFSSLVFMDPLALGVIVAFSKEFREKGGDIRIVNMKGDLKRIFEESRLSRVYETYESVQEAERSFV